MAISKIHPIRRTLNKAIDYIINPTKTQNELLITTYGCSKETLAEEFAFTRKQGSEIGNTLAQHVIQSFKPNEVDAATAHKIGIELANRLTSNQHEYLIATHIDKDHIHNHIIFNQVNFITHKKFRSNIKTTQLLRQISDDLCVAHRLSIIQEPLGKGISHFEWLMRKAQKSYKKKLQNSIDACIETSNSYDEFISAMLSLRYKVKYGKHLAFRMNDQEHFTNAKSLGTNYSEEQIKLRISNHHPVLKSTSRHSLQNNSSIDLIQNVKNYIDNPVYREKVTITNIKKLAETYNYLKTNGIDSLDTLSQKEQDIKSSLKELSTSIKEIEIQLADLHELLKYMERAKQYTPIYNEYLKSNKSASFRRQYCSELMLYEAAQKYIKEKIKFKENIDAGNIRKEVSLLSNQHLELTTARKAVLMQQHQISQVKKNLSTILATDTSIKMNISQLHIHHE